MTQGKWTFSKYFELSVLSPRRLFRWLAKPQDTEVELGKSFYLEALADGPRVIYRWFKGDYALETSFTTGNFFIREAKEGDGGLFGLFVMVNFSSSSRGLGKNTPT